MRDRLQIGAGRGRPAAGQGRQRRPTDTHAVTAAVPRSSDAEARSSGAEAASAAQPQRRRLFPPVHPRRGRAPRSAAAQTTCKHQGTHAGQMRLLSSLAAAQPTAAKGCPAGPGFTYIAWTRPWASWTRTVAMDDRRLKHPARLCVAAALTMHD
jgi:hypothetical protein